ncbi:MAG: 1-acyl-sn-glycerol-3-phosphate acyltransferase [Syntrophus sp. (in: bacteria)]|nr:1-acyl-sn-glycerol-3-phosphate acyltransferase [Syntrophus sp. (in: bacteria)]
MRQILAFFIHFCSTIFFSCAAIVVSLFGSQDRFIHKLARLWGGVQLKASGITVSLHGAEHIPESSCIFMSNHQSALDIYALLVALPVSFKWVAKRELFSLPFVGWTMKRARYISLDRENPREAIKAIDNAARQIRAGANIVIFPEGTRSADGQLLPFKKGVFTLALRAGVPIVPVGIQGSSALQPKACFIPQKKGVIYINIGEPIIPEETGSSAKTKVMLEVKASIERLIACQEI